MYLPLNYFKDINNLVDYCSQVCGGHLYILMIQTLLGRRHYYFRQGNFHYYYANVKTQHRYSHRPLTFMTVDLDGKGLHHLLYIQNLMILHDCYHKFDLIKLCYL